MIFMQNYQIVPVLKYGDLNAGANLYTDSINMKNFHRATFLIQIHTLGVADAHLWAYSGAADATYTSTLKFNYAFGGAVEATSGCDLLTWANNLSGGVPVAVHLLNATYSNYLLVVDVDASDMDVANSEEWLALDFADTDGGATGNVTVIAILEPRHAPGAISAIV